MLPKQLPLGLMACFFHVSEVIYDVVCAGFDDFFLKFLIGSDRD